MRGLPSGGWARAALAAASVAALSIAVSAATPAGPLGFLEALARVYTTPSLLEFSLLYAGPVVLSAVGLAVAYRAGFITIGSEGQVLLGSLAAVWLLAYHGAPQGAAGEAAAAALAALVGAGWGVVVGLLRAYAGVNEILSSLMLNYVALSLVNYAVAGPLRAGPFTASEPVPPGYSVGPLGVLAASAAAAGAFEAVLRRTKLGLAAEAYGPAPRAGATYTLPPTILYPALAALAGAAAGLGGALAVLGFQRSLQAMSQPPGYGYMGVLVAWLAAARPAAALPAGVFFATLVAAGYELRAMGAPLSASLALQAAAVLAAAAARSRGG